MFIMHIALQGCLRASGVPYGLTPDTGGHIKYLLELVAAAEAGSATLRQQIVTRRFVDARLGRHYAEPFERISDRAAICRIDGRTDRYLAKEDLQGELPDLADSLERHIRALPAPPDVIHAHYADAGTLAVEMKRRLGIPFVFTAHSLGRVKSATQGGMAPCAVLRARIAAEERVIARADRIVASSMDEAELQYGLYEAARPEIVRVNPPGCNLGAFAAAAGGAPGADPAQGRFLADPDKPPILALARPVLKKNLAGLIHSYGRNPDLQRVANLVIYAGNRTRIADEDPEPRGVLRGLLELVDDYDLWGKVALPRMHRQEDVPGIYNDAVRRRGVFANLALNEPFGLTFLEAAASGLPVVATNRGGPNDIVARCRNGVLVDPADPAACGAALHHLLTDAAAWDDASRRGLEACGYYAWDRHARDYLADMEWLAATKKARAAAPRAAVSRMLVCDIDNTLTGDAAALGRLRDWIEANPATAFGVATGRSLHGALDIIRQWQIPVPHFLITSVGSEIYWAEDRSLQAIARDPGWPPAGPQDWRPDALAQALSELPWLRPQPPREQRRFKRSYFLKDSAQCRTVKHLLQRAGLKCELIYSHGEFLDLLPEGVSKGHAIRHVARKLSVAPANIWAAGDSGNDVHMLEMVGHPIIVGNHSQELAHLRRRPASYFARRAHAGGVLEGLLRGDAPRTPGGSASSGRASSGGA